jgi:predicted membrane protein
MSLLSVLIALVIAGVVLWLVNTYLPMDGKIKSILNVVVVIMVIVWLLNVFGIFGPQSNIHVGNFHMGW